MIQTLTRIPGHPYEPTIAASGIDNTIKIYSPDRRAQEDARRGINILDPDNPANVPGRQGSPDAGLKSRKRMQDSYRIMSQNDVDRQGGMNEAYITVRSFVCPYWFRVRLHLLSCHVPHLGKDYSNWLYREPCWPA